WVLSVEVIGIISGAWFLVVFSSTFIQLRRRDRQELTRNPSFPATVFVMLLYSGGVLLSVTLFLGLRKQHEAWWLQLLNWSFALLAFYGWPRTIHFDETSIWQRSLFGVKRRIRYEDIQYVNADHTASVITVGSTNF